ncbi:MAG: hypothetical protein NTZ18_03060 [Candidatus Komeilibacteria bacterium]|nr:hypothetical protein [Candidatus Komeilibacteria bacterium]
MNKFFQQSGTALLLAMLIMASIITVSSATSRLVINEVVQSSQLDKAIVAFYGAESGLERGLWQTRQAGGSASTLNQLTATLDNNASYQLIAQDTEDVLYASLAANESYQADIFNPNSLDGLSTPVKAVRISWEGMGSWLDLSWAAWTTSGALGNPGSVSVSQASSPYILQLNDSSAYLYRLRLIARQAGAGNITITAYSNVNPAGCAPVPFSSCQVPFPARISLKGIGEYPHGAANASRQAISVSLPASSPLSGLYDYVLYSEGEIKKEN